MAENRRDAYDTLITVSLLLGLGAAWGADLLRIEASWRIPPDAPYGTAPPVTRIWALLTYLGLAGVMVGGFLAFLRDGYRRIGRATLFLFVSMQAWVTIHAAVAFWGTDFGLEDIVHGNGPATYWALLATFAGMDRSRWRSILLLMRGVVIVAVVLALVEIPTLSFTSRLEVSRKLFDPMYLLLWTSPVFLLGSYRVSSWRRAARIVPFAVLAVCVVLLLARAWTIMVFLYLPVLWRMGRREVGQGATPRRIVGPVLVSVLVSFAALWLVFEPQVSTGSRLFLERGLEDTRSNQFKDFFPQVGVWDLVLGKGPRATWLWAGEPYRYIDCPYLAMLFIGGIPLLLGYASLIVVPAVKALRRGAAGFEGALAVVLLMWGLALTGFSTYPGVRPILSHYLICLYAGRCVGWLTEERS